MTEIQHRWPCAECGADLRFTPGSTELKCDHCGHVQPIPDAPAPRARALGELDLATGLKDDLPGEAMEDVRITPCPNCGAEVEFKGAAHAAECPFCATPVAIGTGEARRIKPQALVPFALTEDQARAALGTWLKSLWFAPNGLTDYARKGRALSGVYVPYWTFDAATRSRYIGQRGDHYFETRTVTRNGRTETEQVRKTRWTRVSGWVSRRFDDVPVMASQSLPRDHTAALEPWDLTALEPYRTDFLAGFTAEGYTVGLADGHRLGREVMAGVIASDVRRDIGGDEQQIDSLDIDWSAETFKHVLLPIWLAAYRFDGRSFRVVISGQSGRVSGERPWSKWKIAFAILLVALVAGGLFLLSEAR